MVVVAVDEQDIDRGPRQTAGRHQPAKPGADDHNSRLLTSHR